MSATIIRPAWLGPARELPTDEQERDSAIIGELEAPLRDLDRMAQIADDLMFSHLQTPDDKNDLDLAHFAVKHLAEMTRELVSEYYRLQGHEWRPEDR